MDVGKTMVRDEEGKKNEEQEEEGSEICKFCGNHPCSSLELESMLVSIVETYQDIKSNRQMRYLMYTDSTKYIFGTGLGKGVRKKLPSCVQMLIRKLAPDEHYTGFKQAKLEHCNNWMFF